MNPSDFASAIEFYGQNYTFHGPHVLDGTERTYLNSANPQNCRFCGRVAPATQFSNTSHAFPELLGNRVLIAADECDECNRRFSIFDDNLAKVTNFQRVTARVRGKKGIPAYKSNDKQTEWRTVNGRANISSRIDHDFVAIDEDKKEVRVVGQTQPYIPRFAFKSLVKMALAVMPSDDLPHFQRTLDWLILTQPEKDKWRLDAKVMLTMIGAGQRFRYINYVLLRRKYDAALCPHYSFFVGWSHYAYQIILPFSTQDSHLKGSLQVKFLPTPFAHLPQSPPLTYRTLDWSSLERRTDEKPTVTFKFEEIVETRSPNPPPE